MIDKIKDKIKDKIINDAELGLTPFQIDYIVEELEKINVWFEVARNETITALEDIYNDELYRGYEKELEKISQEDIDAIAWRVSDYDVWDDVYESARYEILEIIESEEEH